MIDLIVPSNHTASCMGINALGYWRGDQLSLRYSHKEQVNAYGSVI
jgi:hypothetical protein